MAKGPNVNLEFFRKPSPELFYILGLWSSDGFVYENSIAIDMTDKDVIDWVAETIEYKNAIKEIPKFGGFYTKSNIQTSTGCKLRFRSPEVTALFAQYGIVPRKSLTMKFPDIPKEYLHHYIRGVFDGDGGIYVQERFMHGKFRTRTKVHFTSGSLEFLEQLKSRIEENTGCDVKITRGTRCFIYAFESKKAVLQFAEWLYQGDSYGMKRKKDKFIEIGANIA